MKESMIKTKPANLNLTKNEPINPKPFIENKQSIKSLTSPYESVITPDIERLLWGARQFVKRTRAAWDTSQTELNQTKLELPVH